MGASKFKFTTFKMTMQSSTLANGNISIVEKLYNDISIALQVTSKQNFDMMPPRSSLTPQSSLRSIILSPLNYLNYSVAKSCYDLAGGMVLQVLEDKVLTVLAPNLQLILSETLDLARMAGTSSKSSSKLVPHTLAPLASAESGGHRHNCSY